MTSDDELSFMISQCKKKIRGLLKEVDLLLVDLRRMERDISMAHHPAGKGLMSEEEALQLKLDVFNKEKNNGKE